MNFSAYDLVKSFEGLRLNAYQDQGGVWTIGYGHTAGVKAGDVVTIAEARDLLDSDLEDAVQGVNTHVTVPLSQDQFDALVLLAYNIGVGDFAKSTLLRKLNAGDFAGAAAQFDVWNKIRVNGRLEVSNGLVNRRARERALFEGKRPATTAVGRVVDAVIPPAPKFIAGKQKAWIALAGTALALAGQPHLAALVNANAETLATGLAALVSLAVYLVPNSKRT